MNSEHSSSHSSGTSPLAGQYSGSHLLTEVVRVPADCPHGHLHGRQGLGPPAGPHLTYSRHLDTGGTRNKSTERANVYCLLLSVAKLKNVRRKAPIMGK